MNEELLGPCGDSCEYCPHYKKERTPYCSGCGNQKGHPFHGMCRVYVCASEHRVGHCGICGDFPCDLFIGQYNPEHGPDSAVFRAGLLAYRRKNGMEKYLDLFRKLKESTR